MSSQCMMKKFIAYYRLSWFLLISLLIVSSLAQKECSYLFTFCLKGEVGGEDAVGLDVYALPFRFIERALP